MMKSKQRRTFVLFVRVPLLALAVFILGMGIFTKRGFLDFRRMVRENDQLQKKLLLVQDQRRELERQITLFEKDPTEQERVVRERLGYIKPNETIIEF